MTGLERLRELAKRIADYEETGDHAGAEMLWELFEDEISSMPVDQARNTVKQLLVEQSGSKVRLVSGVRGLFSRVAS